MGDANFGSKFIEDPLKDGKSKIELIEMMGNELSIVNSARVSYNRRKKEIDEKDIKLIKFLVKNKHTSPFRHVVFQFRIKAPLFVARQWWKHVVASSHIDEQNGWNEVSFRYTNVSDFDFYIPTVLLKQSKDNKQASSSEVIEEQEIYKKRLKEYVENGKKLYQEMIEKGISKEQARIILPNCIYTSWIWTCSLQALLHFIGLRNSEEAQKEIKKYADVIESWIENLLPNVYEAFKEKRDAF